MKLTNIFFGIIGGLVASFTSCDIDYDAPPLAVPTYTGAAANMTIAQLKTKYATATQEKPDTITDSIIVKAYVGGNDEGGNIYKTLYVQDSSAAIALLVDQSSVYSTYRVGQEVYLDLKGMVISAYGGELQIGYPGAYLFRTSWADFQTHVLKNGWADTASVSPLTVSDFSVLNSAVARNSMRLVRLTGVKFNDGGTLNFAEANGYGNRTLTDAQGNTIAVRTSNYANFATTKLPSGTGTVMGILGRYNGAWQILIRTIDDVYGFSETSTSEGGSSTGTTAANATTIFLEEFGTTVAQVGTNWPSVDIYTGWTNQNLTFSDPVMTGTFSRASIRTTSTLTSPHLWMAANYNSQLHIAGFTTAGYDSVSVSYRIAANLSTGSTTNQDVIKVIAGTDTLSVPSVAMSTSNSFQSVTISGINAGFTTLTFDSQSALNTYGFRIDDIQVTGYKGGTSTGGTTITPTN